MVILIIIVNKDLK